MLVRHIEEVGDNGATSEISLRRSQGSSNSSEFTNLGSSCLSL